MLFQALYREIWCLDDFEGITVRIENETNRHLVRLQDRDLVNDQFVPSAVRTTRAAASGPSAAASALARGYRGAGAPGCGRVRTRTRKRKA